MERIAHLLTIPKNELYNYTVKLPLEDSFSPAPTTIWLQDNWQLSIALSVLYAITIFAGQKVMSKRSSFELEGLLTYWNAALAIFSILGSLRTTPEFFHVLIHHGFRYSVCTAGYAQISVTGLWMKLFAFSKALELIDTVFIVLRKRPLMFLHWYHHITVLIYSWHACKDHTAGGRWFIWMNFNVHAIMYSYYALRSCGWRFPKWIPMSITCMQLAQMVLGCIVNFEVYRTKSSGQFCQQTYENLFFSFAMYFSYFVLFVHFFYEAYLKKGNRFQQHQKKLKEQGDEGEKKVQ